MDNCFLCSLPALLSTDGIYVQITTDICNESGVRPPGAPGSNLKSHSYKLKVFHLFFSFFTTWALCTELSPFIWSVRIPRRVHTHIASRQSSMSGRTFQRVALPLCLVTPDISSYYCQISSTQHITPKQGSLTPFANCLDHIPNIRQPQVLDKNYLFNVRYLFFSSFFLGTRVLSCTGASFILSLCPIFTACPKPTPHPFM